MHHNIAIIAYLLSNAAMVYFILRYTLTCGWQVKPCDPFTTRAIPGPLGASVMRLTHKEVAISSVLYVAGRVSLLTATAR